jgi:thioredoxin reductase (NADPH)
MHTTEEADERFYRDTESIAFPALSDEQLATLESLGTRRKVNRGEIIYKTGQRDVPFHLVLSGELEVFESRDGEEQILGVPGPRDFVGDISMLTGTAVIATVRGKAEESEVLQIPAARFRRALAEFRASANRS